MDQVFLQGRNLGIGQNDRFFGNVLLQCAQSLLEGSQIVAQPDRAHP